MTDIFTNLFNGFGIALQPYYLLLITLGGIMGTIIGMLPGLGPATGVAVLLPMTYAMGPTASLITMTGIYMGAMFGGSRSSILINTPGDGAALAATFDGYDGNERACRSRTCYLSNRIIDRRYYRCGAHDLSC